MCSQPPLPWSAFPTISMKNTVLLPADAEEIRKELGLARLWDTKAIAAREGKKKSSQVEHMSSLQGTRSTRTPGVTASWLASRRSGQQLKRKLHGKQFLGWAVRALLLPRLLSWHTGAAGQV